MLIKNHGDNLVSRRNVLRGVVGGGMVTVGLPFLDIFLNVNGTALANEKPLPQRFGTWVWGLGMDKSVWVPKKVGSDYDLPEQLTPLKNVKQHVNILSNFNVPTGGRPNLCHFTGSAALRTAMVPASRTDLPVPTIDVLVADVLGGTSRFNVMNAAATGIPSDSYSWRNGNAINPPDISAIEMYHRIFGPDFQDPNSPTFTPRPETMIRKSVLSGILEQKSALEKTLGSEDKARMDQYFTSLRELEGRLERQLQKPAPAPNCNVKGVAVPPEIERGTDVDLLDKRHNAMTDLMVSALMCNQTNVFNMVYTPSGSTATLKGNEKTHHTITHEEPVDDKLGYQPTNSIFVKRAMGAWAYFVDALAKVPEGDGTLLDHSVVFAHSDQEWAKTHTINGIPMMTAGRAYGRIKTGMHIDGKADPGSRVGLTLMRAVGVGGSEWGHQDMLTSREISEIVA